MKNLTKILIPFLMSTALISSPMGTARSAAGGVRVGVLTCDSVPGTRINLIVHSKVKVRCIFRTPQGSEHYTGETGIGLGLDFNWERQEEIIFAVLMASSDVSIGSHALAGEYWGGKVSATAGLGVGVASLVGGSGKGVALEPFAVEGSSGLGIAAGVSYLTLAAE